ncbi:MAG: dynamin family protein [Desulfovibrionaceae bacterium]|nr:dynamin family protein [Desulfovibrionaceae bacterium]
MIKARSRIEDANLKILIAGQFKTGKSTIINALLGKNILPAYSTPCTAVITEINYADTPRAELVFKPNLTTVPDDLCPKALEHINAHKPNVPDLILEGETLESELEDFLVIPANGKEQRDAVAESPYALCRLFWPLDLCRNNVEIIDSPGLNEAAARDKTTMDYVPKVDMVVHVLTALQCYSKSDANFDRDVVSLGNPPLVFLINRFDQINNDRERERLRNHVFTDLKLQEKTGDFGRNGVLFISGYQALTAREENDEKAFTKSCFNEFETTLAHSIVKQRMKIKFGNIRNITTELIKFTTNHLIPMQSLLDKNLIDLQNKFSENKNKFKELEEREVNVNKKIKQEINSLEKDIKSSLLEFFYDFCDSKLEILVEHTPVSEVSVFNSEEDVKRIVEQLDAAVKDGLKDAFQIWVQQTGNALLESRLEEIRESIGWELRQFKEQLSSLRTDLGLANIEHDTISNDTSDDFIDAFLNGGALGGILSGVGVFLAARFFSILAGPFGWIATGILTLVSALFSMFNANEAHTKIKQKYTNEAIKSLRSRVREMTDSIASNITEEFGKKILPICDEMNRKIEGSKATIQEAIHQLGASQKSVDEQKVKLEHYQKALQALCEEGMALADRL